MLKKITTSIKSLGTKSLILIIALSFAAWGVGDIFTGGSNPTVATVGNTKIALKHFNLSLEYNALWSGAMLSQQDMTEAMTANMEKRDASFNKLVDVKKFNETDS